MCTYNGEKHVQEQLDSIARQKRLPDELVVCDDNSADNTVALVKAFAAIVSFPVRIYENKSNVGSTLNFDQAIKLCDGDIIVLSDQDDVWHQDKLTSMEKAFNDSSETGVVFSNAEMVNENLSPLGYTVWDTSNFSDNNKSSVRTGKAFEVLLNHNVVTGATMAFLSKYKNIVLPIHPLWVHDGWVAIIIATQSKIHYVDKCLTYYRQHDNQQLGGLSKNNMEKFRLSKSVDSYNAQILKYEALLEHLLKLDMSGKEYCLADIREKISHLLVRNAIYESGIVGKMVKAGQELLKGRYHRYSNGFMSFLKDVFLINRHLTP
jgi:glycosyltransferase involved in cell wall biosynthesis